MFGNSGTQPSWANPQQNQQPPQQPQQPQTGSVFGQPSGFGSTAGGGTSQPTLGAVLLPLSAVYYLLSSVWIWWWVWPKPTTAASTSERNVWEPCFQSKSYTCGRRLDIWFVSSILHGILLTGALSGAFGGNNNPSMFNTTKPTTGFSAFGGGGTSAFGTGGSFNSTAPSQSAPSNTALFGQPSTTGSAFGTSTFANKSTASAFGPTSCMSSGELLEI